MQNGLCFSNHIGAADLFINHPIDTLSHTRSIFVVSNHGANEVNTCKQNHAQNKTP